jgi:catechol 2,3-dioxygenase-like lactoylglutathione lyase family enzyme
LISRAPDISRRDWVCCIVAIIIAISPVHAQTNPPRPHILGLAHVAFRVSDMSRTEAFYEGLLGFEEPFSLKDDSGKITTAVVKVNDSQYVELLPGDTLTKGQMDHFALYTDDLVAMRKYLVFDGVDIFKDIHPGRVGNNFLSIRDPDGHLIEILQYSPDSLTGISRGKSMPSGRVSDHITHVGILVSHLASALKFYRDTLGFREASRDNGDGQPGEVDLRVTDSSDYLELIPFSGMPSANLKFQNHICLANSNVRKAVANLEASSASRLLVSPVTLQTGNGLQERANLFDPDGVRIEIMQPVAAKVTPTEHPVPNE